MSQVQAGGYAPPSSPSDDRPAPIGDAAWAPFGRRAPMRAPREPKTNGPVTATESIYAVGRYVRWGLAFALLIVFWAILRVQVDQLRVDIEKLEVQRSDLVRDQDQLLLEYAGRRSVPEMERAADGLVTAPLRSLALPADAGGAP